MTYNIHPILVHFPIALLFLYSVIKILPFQRYLPRVAWRDLERVTLLVGVAGAVAALLTGEIAEHIIRPSHQIVEAHSLFANIVTLLYGVLLVGEVASTILTHYILQLEKHPGMRALLWHIESIFCHPFFSRLLALIAVIALAITGALGGVMAFGISADPLSAPLLNILGITP